MTDTATSLNIALENYRDGVLLPKDWKHRKILGCFVDGGCLKNGTSEAEGYGSYKIYDLSPTVLNGIVPDNLAALIEMDQLEEVMINSRFPLTQQGKRMTNNIAEACSMQMLFAYLLNSKKISKDHYIVIFSDSQLILNQLQGIYRVNNAWLSDIYKNIHRMIQNFERKFRERVWGVVQMHHISGDDMKRILGH